MAVSQEEPTLATGPSRERDFCIQHGILTHAEYALEVVKQSFPTRTQLTVKVIEDPETAEESLVIEVTTRGDSVDSVMVAYDRCIEAWVANIPPEALQRICLTFAIY